MELTNMKSNALQFEQKNIMADLASLLSSDTFSCMYTLQALKFKIKQLAKRIITMNTI